MKNTYVYKETQSIGVTDWKLYLPWVVPCSILLAVAIYRRFFAVMQVTGEFISNTEFISVTLLSLAIGIGVPLYMRHMSLKVFVTREQLRLCSLFYKRSYRISDIEKWEICDTSGCWANDIEFGLFGRSKLRKVPAEPSPAVQLFLVGGEKPVIESKRPDQLAEAIAIAKSMV